MSQLFFDEYCKECKTENLTVEQYVDGYYVESCKNCGYIYQEHVDLDEE